MHFAVLTNSAIPQFSISQYLTVLSTSTTSLLHKKTFLFLTQVLKETNIFDNNYNEIAVWLKNATPEVVDFVDASLQDVKHLQQTKNEEVSCELLI